MQLLLETSQIKLSILRKKKTVNNIPIEENYLIEIPVYPFFIIIIIIIVIVIIIIIFFFYRHWRFTGQQEKGRDHLLFHSTTSTRSRTLRYLFTTLHVRWISRNFNPNACVYQTATRWDLAPLLPCHLIDWLMMQCSFVYLMNWF